LSEELHDQLSAASIAATRTPACARRLRQHMLAALLNQSGSTITNLICISGGQHQDWTADYRLYSKDRVDEQPLFSQNLP